MTSVLLPGHFCAKTFVQKNFRTTNFFLFFYKQKPMPYGRKNYRSSYGRTRRTYRPRKMAVKPPPQKKTTRTYVRRNAYAVNRLMRDVRYLKQARYGAVQKNLQVLPPSRPLTPTATQPVLCCINNIQADNITSGAQGCPWYQVTTTGELNIISRFQRNNDTYFDQMNDDIIDGGIAYLNYLKLTIRINCIPDNGVQISNKRVRIDMFKQRTSALVSPVNLADVQQLPAVAAIQKLNNMANPTLNKFNPVYFELIDTKFVFLNPSKVDPENKGTGASLKYVSMQVPRKHLGRITQQNTNPAYDGGPDTNGVGWNVQNMPIHQRIWLMISSDDPSTFPGTDPELQINVSRYISWRDYMGSAYL